MSQCSSAGCIGDNEKAFLSVPLPRTITMRVLRPIQYPVHLPAHPSIMLPSGALPMSIQFREHLDDRDNNSNSVSDDEKPERSEEDGRILGMPATMSPCGDAKPIKSAEKNI